MSADDVKHEHEKGNVEENMTKMRSSSSSINPTRRPATAEEKQRALSLARSMKTAHPSFIAELRQSNVSQSYVLVIPHGFAVQNMPGCDQSVLLRLPSGGTWQVNYIVHYKATKFGSGWRQFVVDNELEKDDVCLFEIIIAKNYDFVLEVNIFRAVTPAIVLPTELSTEGKGNTKGRDPIEVVARR
ncbi:unnamed protein product [Musa acuminata subsp. malaccensis]|nr:unnamed protein product [Musa acuminata subsp. malaccensis]